MILAKDQALNSREEKKLQIFIKKIRGLATTHLLGDDDMEVDIQQATQYL